MEITEEQILQATHESNADQKAVVDRAAKLRFIEQVSHSLTYLADPDLPDQWKACEAHAEIIWDNYVAPLIEAPKS